MQSSKASLRASQIQADDMVVHTTFFDGLDKRNPRNRKLVKQWKNLSTQVNDFLESLTVGIITTIATIYALFADDVRQLISDFKWDDLFYYISSVVFAMFCLEILLSALARKRYFLSFFFWLDIFSTISLLFDIGWVSDVVFDTENVTVGGSGAVKLARAARASRVGSRATRILKIVRLIRLIRIVKLYKAAHNTLGPAEEEVRRMSESRLDDESIMKPKPSLIDLNKNGTLSKDLAPNLLNNKDEIKEKDKEGKDKESDSLVQRKSGFNLEEESSPKRRRSDSGVGSLNFASKSPEESPANTKEDGKKKRISLQKKPKNNKGVEKDRRNTARRSVLAEDLKELKKQPDFPHETNVGRKLTDLTTKRVITLILSVLITIPIFNTSTYVSIYSSGESGLRTLWLVNQSGTPEEFNFVVENYIETHKKERNPLIGLDILATKYYVGIDENELRNSEKQYYNIDGKSKDADDSLGYAVFSLRPDAELDAILGIVRTLFVTFVLAAAALSFAKDTNDLVLAPMESMLVKVKRIAANPLAAAQIEEEDALMCEELEKQGKKKALKKKKDEGNYETSILENTILKLGALLAIGFGEAGSNIIAQNMSKGGEVDPMIPGKKCMAIFGFCDIRNFTDATEVLQEGVMVFVNEIAEIVHGTINEYSGAANKNIGDAFLLVWKFPPEEVEEDPDDASNLILKRSVKVSQLADMSIISFLKVMAGVHKSRKLLKYRHNEELNMRLPNYSVKMGFGLHVGWAIEGAIGSEYKIDASYLSPNVNMASRLEAATKQFGVPLLISGHMYNIVTLETKKQLRHIDRVTVKGSTQPIDLYTCDVDFESLTVEKGDDSLAMAAIEKKKARVLSRNKRDELREKAFSEKIRVAKAFLSDKDIATMRHAFTKEFYKAYSTGMVHYISGDWMKAKEMFENTSYMIPGHRDGPSQTLLDFMKDHDFRAPPDWKGFRELTEK